MKKWLSVLLVLMLAMPCVLAEVSVDEAAVAEMNGETVQYIVEQKVTDLTDEELEALAKTVAKEQESRGIEAPPAILQKGSKGDEVQKLQSRLIELNYLSGSADGDYGNKTKAAVEKFQKAAGLPVTGIANEATQKALYAKDAPVCKEYMKLDYKAVARDPDAYTGKNYTFTGKVLQVLEEDLGSTTYTVMRIGTGGYSYYDNVVYAIYYRPDGEKRILEDDLVTVYAECEGLHTYESVRGDEITIPKFSIESIEVR